MSDTETNKTNDHIQVGDRLGVSRTTVFLLWASGELPSIKIRNRRFSTDRQISEYPTRLEQEGSQA